MAEAITRYLTAIRATCKEVMESPQDSGSHRRLEQVCHVLTTLIADEKASPRLQARASGQFGRLLEPHLRSPAPLPSTADFAGAKAAVAKLIASPEAIAGSGATDFLRRAVEIEREYYLGLDEALRDEAAAPELGAVDGPRGDVPDAAALARYLSDLFAQPVEVAEISTVSLGYSKATFLVGIRASRDLPDALVIRMDRPFNFLGTTVVDEYPILETLYQNGVRVPQPHALERTGKVLGQPFLVVSRVAGRNLGSHFSFPPRNPALCAELAAQLARIHRLPLGGFGPGLRGAGQSAQEQIDADIARYHADWSALHAASPTLETAFWWIKRHARDAVGERTFVHGDFSLSNLLVSDEGEIAAILDWEFAQMGPCAADLGWMFTAAGHLSSWDDFLAAYRAAGGRVPAKKQLDFFVLWGLVRLAVMSFQVESGVEDGRMRDIKHAYAAVTFARECVRRVAAFLGELLAAEPDGHHESENSRGSAA